MLKTPNLSVLFVAALVAAGSTVVLLAPSQDATATASLTQPYAGLTDRAIKALPAERVAGLLRGEGLGYALAAELNGYPGPRHALDLSNDLKLTNSQTDALQTLFDDMNAQARTLGAQLVDAEAALDRAFADGEIDAAALRAMTQRIALIDGQLRNSHLQAHLKTMTILNKHQTMLYNKARGYSDGHGHHNHRHQ